MILYMICGSHGQLGDGASEHEATCMMALGESAFWHVNCASWLVSLHSLFKPATLVHVGGLWAIGGAMSTCILLVV